MTTTTTDDLLAIPPFLRRPPVPEEKCPRCGVSVPVDKISIPGRCHKQCPLNSKEVAMSDAVKTEEPTIRTNDPLPWQRRLAGEKVVAVADNPDYGFYRVRSRDRMSWSWVTYWFAEGTGALRCRRDGVELDEVEACTIWSEASENAITIELYKHVKAGGAWPDHHPTVLRQRKELSNVAPEDDTFESLSAMIEELERDSKKLIAAGAAKNDADSDIAADLAKWLGELHSRADKARVRDKAPHLAAGREVDAKWNPYIDRASIYARVKQIVCKPWLDILEARKQAREAEARAIAAKAAKEAEEKAAAEEEARLRAEQAAQAGDTAAMAQATQEAEALAEAAQAAQAQAETAAVTVREIAEEKVSSGTRRGGIHLRTVRDYEFTDRAAALAYFAESEEISETLDKLVKRAVKAKLPVPGVKVNKGTKAA